MSGFTLRCAPWDGTRAPSSLFRCSRMSFVCLWSPAWLTVVVGPSGLVNPKLATAGPGAASSAPQARAYPPSHPPLPEIAATLLARAPRVAIGKAGEQGVIWADAHGFSVHGKAALAAELIVILERRGIANVHAGVADTPVAAQLAAVYGARPLVVVPPGTDRTYVALFPLTTLHHDPRLRPLFFGIGVTTCGELAALDRESIEVRLGATAVPLWRLARADDPRLIFSSMPPDAPHASLDWVEYALKDPMRLLFVLNNLIERVCTTLATTGESARELTVEFALTNTQVHIEVIRAARATANRRTWGRITRARLERITLAAAVMGITVHASRIAEREAPQGDLFDKGLASSQSTEDAVARLIEDQGDVVVVPQNSAHPLLDERTTWVPRTSVDTVRERLTPANGYATVATGSRAPTRPQLLLQLAPAPLAISVETAPRRDHLVPVRYRDANGWHEIVNVAGPERVSGRHWDADHAYAREYFRCVTKQGVLVWIFRDANARVPGTTARTHASTPAGNRWFLHGWWD